MAEEIVNRVAKSGVITIDLEEFYPRNPRLTFDFTEGLWQQLVLKEKDFRAFLETVSWLQFKNAFVNVIWPQDAIIQTWAFMLVASKLDEAGASLVYFGAAADMENQIAEHAIEAFLKNQDLNHARVVVKGCAELSIPAHAYGYLAFRLRPKVKSLMFGEPCSTVPIFKQSTY